MTRRFLSILAALVCFIFGLTLAVNPGEAAKKASLTKVVSDDKKAVLECPKGSFIIDQDSGTRVENEVPTIITAVYFSQAVSSACYANHTFASDIFQITVSDAAYLLSEQGKLTLTYDKNINPLVADRLSVWWKNGEPDFTSCNPLDNCLGGYVNAGKNTITVPFQVKGKDVYYAVLLDQREPDFEFAGEDKWSYSCVMPLWSKEIMKTGDKKISEPITRREFAFMMVRGLGLPLVEEDEISNENRTFFDILSSDEDFRFIETAARYGIINGFPPSQGGTKPGFETDQNNTKVKNLTREQAAAIIARVANLKLQTDAEKVRQDLEKIFSEDGGKISPWAAPAVLAAYKAKFMVGDKNEQGKVTTFRPQDNLKRSEAAKITYLLFKKLKKI